MRVPMCQCLSLSVWYIIAMYDVNLRVLTPGVHSTPVQRMYTLSHSHCSSDTYWLVREVLYCYTYLPGKWVGMEKAVGRRTDDLRDRLQDT